MLAIIRRIDNLLLEECLKCKTWYSIGKDDVPTISCSSCGQGCHESCYKDLGPVLEEFPGLHHLCSRCKLEETPAETPKKTVSHRISLDQSATIAQNTPLTPHNREPNHGDTDEFEEESYEDNRPICQLLRRGVCPYGISGRTPIGGQICEFSHLKRCQPYCKYGTDPTNGCDKGRECNLLHPILCRYALKSKMCTNLKCKFTHLKGTRRYRSRANVEPHEDYEGQYYGRGNDLPQPGNTHQLPIRNPNYNAPSQLEKPFLEQLANQMKEMQKEMRDMKEMYKPTTHQHIPWFPQPLNTQTVAQQPTRPPPTIMPQATQAPQMVQPQIMNQFPRLVL